MSDDVTKQTGIWGIENASQSYFSSLSENKDRMKEILGISKEDIDVDELFSESQISEELRNRYIALVAFGTNMFEKGLSLGSAEDNAVPEPTDDEVFPDPWSQDARAEIQRRVDEGY